MLFLSFLSVFEYRPWKQGSKSQLTSNFPVRSKECCFVSHFTNADRVSFANRQHHLYILCSVCSSYGYLNWYEHIYSPFRQTQRKKYRYIQRDTILGITKQIVVELAQQITNSFMQLNKKTAQTHNISDFWSASESLGSWDFVPTLTPPGGLSHSDRFRLKGMPRRGEIDFDPHPTSNIFRGLRLRVDDSVNTCFSDSCTTCTCIEENTSHARITCVFNSGDHEQLLFI